MPPLPWNQIDTVLLDMDGTLLDLHFDNHFWLEHLPRRFSELRNISREQANAELSPLFDAHAGQLTWYCLDFWSARLQLSIVALKQEVAHLIALREGVEPFLAGLRDAGKRVVLVTNAHRDSLTLKMERVPLEPYFERLISSHDYGFPKEDQRFWATLQQELGFDPARALFIDDSLPILRSARHFGIGHLLAVRLPDSRQGPKQTGEFQAIEHYDDMLEGLAESWRGDTQM